MRLQRRLYRIYLALSYIFSFNSFRSLLKSHSLWVTLYIRNIHTVIGSDKFLVRGNSQFHLARTLSLVYIQAVVIQRLVYSRFTVYTRDIFQVYTVYQRYIPGVQCILEIYSRFTLYTRDIFQVYSVYQRYIPGLQCILDIYSRLTEYTRDIFQIYSVYQRYITGLQCILGIYSRFTEYTEDNPEFSVLNLLCDLYSLWVVEVGNPSQTY